MEPRNKSPVARELVFGAGRESKRVEGGRSTSSRRLAVRSHLDDLLKPAGLTALQYTALTVLERHRDLSSAQLARNSFITAQSMADMITTLEGRGLIERHRDRTDRRRLVVALTIDGRELLDRYRYQVDALEEQMLAGLTRAQISSLRRNLRACHANLAGQGRG